jgi:hypothetical protein
MNNKTPRIVNESFVVSVYDVTEKKLVGIFPSASVCNRYCFDKKNGSITRYIRQKLKSHDNVFARTICFRNANEDQKKMLADHSEHQFLILDPRYWREGFKSAYSGFQKDTRHKMASQGNARYVTPKMDINGAANTI